MGRRTKDCARIIGLSALVCLTGLSEGCAAVDTTPEALSKQPASNSERFGSASDRAKLEACYADARLQNPDLSVHTSALYFAREGKLVFVDVELPETPKLAHCLSEAILSSHPFEAPIEARAAHGSEAVASGAIGIDLGPPPAVPPPRPTLSEVRARVRRVTLEALRQGALHESDAVVRETLNPPPPWPTRDMLAQLDECHRDALRSGAPLVLHRDVLYLARGSQVLLADVSIPEAPELRRCVLERIVKWQSPFPGSSEATTLSGFFLNLGGAEEFPDPPGTLTAELARRRALLERARELGLIQADDPLLERFKNAEAERSVTPTTDPNPRAD